MANLAMSEIKLENKIKKVRGNLRYMRKEWVEVGVNRLLNVSPNNLENNLLLIAKVNMVGDQEKCMVPKKSD